MSEQSEADHNRRWTDWVESLRKQSQDEARARQQRLHQWLQRSPAGQKYLVDPDCQKVETEIEAALAKYWNAKGEGSSKQQDALIAELSLLAGKRSKLLADYGLANADLLADEAWAHVGEAIGRQAALTNLKVQGVRLDALRKPDRERVEAWLDRAYDLFTAELEYAKVKFVPPTKERDIEAYWWGKRHDAQCAFAAATDALIRRARAAGVDSPTLQHFREARRLLTGAAAEEAEKYLAEIVDVLAESKPAQANGGEAAAQESPKLTVAEDSTLLARTMQGEKVFICYSHKDKKFLDDLVAHLAPLQRAGRVSVWSDKQIQPGSQWFNDIQMAMASTKVAVLLVTKDFLASDFIHKEELGPLLKAAAAKSVVILWVLVRKCNWKRTPLETYQAAFPTEKSLAEMRAERDGAWVAICEEIQKAADS